MKRNKKTPQPPFVVALTLICGYGLMLAVLPTDLSAKNDSAPQELLLRDSHRQTDHVVTAKTTAPPNKNRDASVQ